MQAKNQADIYGITGRKEHGKDTFAAHVMAANAGLQRQSKPTFTCMHFAEALKCMSGTIFGLTRDQMYDPLHKEAPFPIPLEMDRFTGRMQQETGLAIEPIGKVARNPREVMQYFGTDYVRRIENNYWVQHTMQQIQSQPRVLIPDTRFPNEVKAIRACGGKIVKIVRLGMPESNDPHPSETEVDNIEPDLLLLVKTGDLSLVARIARLIAQGKFSATLQYDWRNAEKAMHAYTSGTSLDESANLLGGSMRKAPQVLSSLLAYYKPQRSSSGSGGPDNQNDCKHHVEHG